MLVKLAIRNAFRHRLRSLLTILGVMVAILAFGTLLYPALKAAESLDATVAASSERMTRNLDRIQKGTMMIGAGLALMAVLAAMLHGRGLEVVGVDEERVVSGTGETSAARRITVVPPRRVSCPSTDVTRSPWKMKRSDTNRATERRESSSTMTIRSKPPDMR